MYKRQDDATPHHMFKACALVLRDIMSQRQIETSNQVWENQERQVHYLSLEFLMGRSLEKNAFNLGLLGTLRDALELSLIHISPWTRTGR